MGVHAEEFRVSANLSDTIGACRRGMAALQWTEQSSDEHQVPLPIRGDKGDIILGLLSLIPRLRRPVDRYTSRRARAPQGPPDTDAEINAVLRPYPKDPLADLIARISLRERGGFGTDVTISGSNLLATSFGEGRLRTAIGELHVAIANPREAAPPAVTQRDGNQRAPAPAAVRLGGATGPAVDRSPRRVGWVIVAVGVGALAVLPAYFLIDSSDTDPSDPGWGEVAFFFSPILAAAAALAIGLLLVIVAALKLIDVALSTAAKATGLGCVVAPVVYLVLLTVMGEFFGMNSVLEVGLLVFALPILVGVTAVLGAAVRAMRS